MLTRASGFRTEVPDVLGNTARGPRLALRRQATAATCDAMGLSLKWAPEWLAMGVVRRVCVETQLSMKVPCDVVRFCVWHCQGGI